MESAVIDMQKAIEITANNKPLFEDLIRIFFDTYPEQNDLIRQSIQNKDYITLESASHSLKSALKSLAAENACLAAWELEKAGKEKNPHCADLLAALETEINAVREYYEQKEWETYFE